MPKKTSVTDDSGTSAKASKNGKSSCNCDICCRPIVEKKEEAIQCDGECEQWFHRYCAGVSATHFKLLSSSSTPFVCVICNQSLQNAKVSQLLEEVESLKAELVKVKDQLANCNERDGDDEVHQFEKGGANLQEIGLEGWSSVVKRKPMATASIAPRASNYPKAPASSNTSERKFNIIMYGCKESRKGTSRYKRLQNDIKSASRVIQEVCPDISTQEVRDCIRLGKYSEDRNRPLLVKFNRSCNVVSILSNRHKLAKTPGIFIKPHQSPAERTTESTLLRERRSLITSGYDKKKIRIRGSSIFVQNKRYGSAHESEFKIDSNYFDDDKTSDDVNVKTSNENEATDGQTDSEGTTSHVTRNNGNHANTPQLTGSSPHVIHNDNGNHVNTSQLTGSSPHVIHNDNGNHVNTPQTTPPE